MDMTCVVLVHSEVEVKGKAVTGLLYNLMTTQHLKQKGLVFEAVNAVNVAVPCLFLQRKGSTCVSVI